MYKRGTLKVGDTAVGRNYTTLPDRNGMECEIIAPLLPITAFEVRSGAYTTKPRYLVRWADGLESVAQPHTLQKPTRRHRSAQQMRECIAQVRRSARRDWEPFIARQPQALPLERCDR
ncbi:MAG: hypothetical protein ACJ8LG_22835 [Massilia sp.]